MRRLENDKKMEKETKKRVTKNKGTELDKNNFF